MKIEQLELKGFRGFEEATFKFHPKVNLLIGINGAGKTSVLDALAVGLDILISNMFYSGKPYSFKGLKSTDINIGMLKAQVRTTIQLNQKLRTWTVRIGGEDDRALLKKEREDLRAVVDYYSKVASNFLLKNINSQESSTLFPFISLAYYNTNRAFENKTEFKNNESLKMTSLSFSQMGAELLNYRLSSFKKFEEWFIHEENKEIRIKSRKNGKYESQNLKFIRNGIIKFFNEINGDSLFQNLYVDEVDIGNYYDFQKELGLFIDKDGIGLPLNTLSEGERMLILLISDITKRLTIANQHIENFDALKGEGIVLIDEIELHLHPAWQRRVVLALTKVFPNVQFFLTTHSPQVLSTVPNECVHIIEDFKIVSNTPPTKGRDSNSLLWDIFGVKERPKETQDILNRFYTSLEEDNKDLATNYLKKLNKELGENDTTVQKAKLSYEFSFQD